LRHPSSSASLRSGAPQWVPSPALSPMPPPKTSAVRLTLRDGRVVVLASPMINRDSAVGRVPGTERRPRPVAVALTDVQKTEVTEVTAEGVGRALLVTVVALSVLFTLVTTLFSQT
jgi:hypothetical protein